MVLRVLIVLAALISDGISIVNILSGYSYGYESPAFAMYLAIVDLALWITVAYAPDWAWVLLLANLLPFVFMSSGYGAVPVIALVALAFLAYSARRYALITAICAVLAWAIAATVMREDTGLIFLSVFLPLGILALIPGVGLRYMNAQRQVDRQTIEEFDRRALASLEEQRTELARELHDIVAHDITVIAMQARAGAMSRDADENAETFDVIGDSARSALDDLRRLLRIMRDAGDSDDVAEASAGIDLLSELSQIKESLERSGLRVHTTVTGDVDLIPDGVRTTVRRLLREGATNILKHALVEAPVDIELAVSAEAVDVNVVNSIMARGEKRSEPRFAQSGFGIMGLRERVQLLGGRISSGAVEGDRWHLSAHIPFRPEGSGHGRS